MSSVTELAISPRPTAVLDDAHIGHINGALGTIRHGNIAPRHGWAAKLKTLLAILGPGLIVMGGDNDAGAFSTYSQAGQDYGTTLLWTLALLIPVLYVNQEMVLRLGAVSGVGHARLIIERFGRFWGAFSVIDLFLLNALTIVTEFIGVSLALSYLGVSQELGVALAALLIMVAASTGSFRRFERFSLILVVGSLLLVPVFVTVHPPIAAMVAGFFVPKLPTTSRLSEVMLLVIAIVGTTVAPWQLFFQQSYVIDKRIPPRFIPYQRADLWIGIVLVTVGAVALMGLAAATFAGRPEFGMFSDAGGIAFGARKICRLGPRSGVRAGPSRRLPHWRRCCVALHCLRGERRLGPAPFVASQADRGKAFYALYCGLIALVAALVLTPGTPLGLLTNAVQTLAGVLLPSATVFLLLLCNDRAVLGPWVNGRWLNLFTGGVIVVLVLLSIILTASVLYPQIASGTIIAVLAAGSVIALLIYPAVPRAAPAEPVNPSLPDTWRMPALAELSPRPLTMLNKIWLLVLRAYLVVAAWLVLVRILTLGTVGA